MIRRYHMCQPSDADTLNYLTFHCLFITPWNDGRIPCLIGLISEKWVNHWPSNSFRPWPEIFFQLFFWPEIIEKRGLRHLFFEKSYRFS